jgi:hypothetical protein
LAGAGMRQRMRTIREDRFERSPADRSKFFGMPFQGSKSTCVDSVHKGNLFHSSPHLRRLLSGD